MTSVLSRMRPDDLARHPSAGGPPHDDTVALLPIGADLLPRASTGTSGGRTRRLVAIGLVVVAVVAVVGGYLLSLHANSSAASALTAAQDRQRSLQVQQRGFAELVTTQAQAGQLRDEVARLMATDASWSGLLTALDGARGGVAFTSVQANVDDPSASASASAATGTATSTTAGAIGSLSISATAADKPTIASFVDALGGLTGLADPFLSTVTALADASAGGYSFTVTVALTDDLRATAAGRATTTTGGGK